MTAEVDEHFHNADVTFIDANVQRCLTPLVTSIQISTATLKNTNHFRLVTKRRVMDSPVTILVLDTVIERQVSQQSTAKHLY